MSKTVWLVSISILTVFAAAFSLKSGVSETAAGPRLNPAQQVSLSGIQRNAGVKSMPVMMMDDKSFVFTDPIVPADSIPSANKSDSEYGWGPARLTDW